MVHGSRAEARRGVGSRLRRGLRRAGALVLPGAVKQPIKDRLRGSAWFPETRRPRPAPAPAPPPPPPPFQGWLYDLELPPAPGRTRSPATVRVKLPWGFYVAQLLAQKPLAEYETYGLDAYLTVLERAAPGAAYDVGANIGLYALLAAAYTDREAHAFEPSPVTAQAAEGIARASGLQVVVNQSALGREHGTATLYLSDSTDSSNSLNPEFREHAGEVEVPLERLDDYVARTGAVPAVLKVDTETTEHDVLAGAAAVIATHRPWILCEVLHGLSEDNLHEVMDPFGYTIYHLDRPRPEPVQGRMVGDPTWAHYMFLFAPEPVGPDFWDRCAQWREALATVPAPLPPAPVSPSPDADRPSIDVTDLSGAGDPAAVVDLSEADPAPVADGAEGGRRD